SSRRRHTRFSRDWSSDVCSSDLGVTHGVRDDPLDVGVVVGGVGLVPWPEVDDASVPTPPRHEAAEDLAALEPGDHQELVGFWHRSEERRVGKECRCGWWAEPET